MGNPITTTDWLAVLDEKRDDWLASVRAFLATPLNPDPEAGDTPASRLQLARAAAQEALSGDRDRLVETAPFGPDSLIRSYFRAPSQTDPNAEAAWLEGEACETVEGRIVSQPFTSSTTAIYQVEFYGDHGAGGYQQLVELDRMLAQRWVFYDTDAWLTHRAESARAAVAATVPDDEAEA